ncbi:MAG TPA: decarboxylase [Desulfobacteraceae bacterium]|mgnify:CR=1 FL=1|nr:decarboxylase [Desulfobacteraceae bacterium]
MTGMPDILPEAIVKELAANFFNRGKIFTDLANTYGSPLYILDTDVLLNRADRFRAAFCRHLPDSGFYYAMKSNNLPLVSKVMLTRGFGLDVSSGLELDTALKLGAKDIIFSGPGKTHGELNMALENRERVTLLIDSAGELNRLLPLAAGCTPPLRVGIRINITPDGLWQKFGVMANDLPDMFHRINACTGLSLCGLQFHSSWNLDPKRQVSAIRYLGQILKELSPDILDALKFLDIGGGYWPAQGEWLVSDKPLVHHVHPAQTIDTFAREIGNAVAEWIFPVKHLRICFEPGRWICNDAMHILMQVVDQKTQDLVITDAGTNAVGWERFETDYFPVLNLSRPSLTERPCRILGALCTPHDVWGYAVHGEDVRQGDILLIPNQGAYTWSLRQEFIKPLPQLAVLGTTEEGFQKNPPPNGL